MKGFSKFLLVLFSLIVIALSIIVALVSAELITLTATYNALINFITINKIAFLIGSSIFIILGLIGLFTGDNSDDMKTGLAIKTEKGTVSITKDTFETIILSVARNYPELRNVKVDIKLNESGIVANVYTMILPDTVVTTLTTKLQENIKASILKQTTVEIKEANVKIKGVYLEPQKK